MAIDRSVTKTIQLANAKKAEIDYIVSQYQEEWKYIDSEARNYFNTGLSAGRMKCFVNFNHHAQRNKAINNEVKNSKCPRYQENEEWSHVVCYEAIPESNKNKFVVELE